LAASATAFSAALAKLSFDVPTTSITFSPFAVLLDFDSVRIVPLPGDRRSAAQVPVQRGNRKSGSLNPYGHGEIVDIKQRV
jgi:hypothetical protein